MASSMSSSKRRSFSEVDKENVRDDDINDGLESKRRMIDKKEKIRFQIIEEFQKQNLEVPVEMIGRSSANNRIYCKIFSLFSFRRLTRS